MLCTQSNFYRRKLLRREAFTQSTFYTQEHVNRKPVHRAALHKHFSHRRFYTKAAFTHRSFYTHKHFYTWPRLVQSRFRLLQTDSDWLRAMLCLIMLGRMGCQKWVSQRTTPPRACDSPQKLPWKASLGP